MQFLDDRLAAIAAVKVADLLDDFTLVDAPGINVFTVFFEDRLRGLISARR